MMRPPIGFCSFMIRNACWVHRKVPWTIELMTPFHFSYSRSSSSPAAPKPALLNSTSRRPKVAFALANKASTEAGLLTSVGTPSALLCMLSISLTTASSGSGRRPATTTAKPSRASASAEALPMPLPPPVTRATLPFDAMFDSSCCPARIRTMARCPGGKAYNLRPVRASLFPAAGRKQETRLVVARGVRLGLGGGGFRGRVLARQDDPDLGAEAGCAVDRDQSAVQLDNRLAQRQAEAGAVVAPRYPAVDLAEGGERGRDVLRRHADPGVGDFDCDQIVRSVFGAYGDAAAHCGELHGVGQQVQKNLTQLRRIAPDLNRLNRLPGIQLQSGARALVAHHRRSAL